MTHDAIRGAITDPVALIATLYGEARAEPIEGLIAVGCVIRNRVYADLGLDQKPDWWGESFVECCLKPWQFSCWWEDNSNTRSVYALAEGLLLDRPIGDRNLIAELRWIAVGLIENQLRDHTQQADHYCTTALLKSKPPAWTKNQRPVAVIGHHSFFRLA